MHPIIRALIAASCALVIAQCVILCAATGWRTFTRFPDPDLAKMHEQQGSLTSLFDDPGARGPRVIPNDFAFGLLPTPVLTREALSVTTIAGPALLAGLLAAVPARRARPFTAPATPKESRS
jgi:hypothetical protein